jgi:hypothetical protein
LDYFSFSSETKIAEVFVDYTLLAEHGVTTGHRQTHSRKHVQYTIASNYQLSLLWSSSYYRSTKYWLSDASSSYRALFLFLMVLKVHLAKVVVALVAMPTRQGVTDYTLANRFVVVVVFSLFCRRCFLLPWLCLHMPYASGG